MWKEKYDYKPDTIIFANISDDLLNTKAIRFDLRLNVDLILLTTAIGLKFSFFAFRDIFYPDKFSLSGCSLFFFTFTPTITKRTMTIANISYCVLLSTSCHCEDILEPYEAGISS